MTVLHALDDVREDLETLLGDVLRAVLEEEAEPLPDGVPAPPAPDPGRAASSLLAVADDADDTRLGVLVRVPGRLAQVLAARMFGSDEPTSDDLLDAVGELGNIAGGNVKSLLFGSGGARLSLPSAVLGGPTGPPAARDDAPAPLTVRAVVLGDVAELTLIPHLEGADLVWPPAFRSDLLEGQP